MTERSKSGKKEVQKKVTPLKKSKACERGDKGHVRSSVREAKKVMQKNRKDKMGGRVCPREKTSEGKGVKRKKVHGDTQTHTTMMQHSERQVT